MLKDTEMKIFAQTEIDSGKDYSFTDELKEIISNIGLQYWYTDNFVLRLGYIYDKDKSTNKLIDYCSEEGLINCGFINFLIHIYTFKYVYSYSD